MAATAALSVIPESMQSPLVALVAKLSPDQQKGIQRAMTFATADMLQACQTPEEALELLKELAEAANTDDQARYIPAIYTINHKTQRFQDDAGDAIKGPFKAVIMYFQPTRAFFIENRKLPLCSAIGNIANGAAAPDAQEAWSKHNLTIPELPITWSGTVHNCAGCPFNEFGSDPKTRAGKACKEKYRLFLGLVDGEGHLTGEGVMLNVPSTSLRNWDEYVSRLKRLKPNGKLEPKTTAQVVTGFELEKATGQSQEYAKIIAKADRILTPEEFTFVWLIRSQIVKVAEKLGAEVGESFDETEPASPGAEGSAPAGEGGLKQNDGPGF